MKYIKINAKNLYDVVTDEEKEKSDENWRKMIKNLGIKILPDFQFIKENIHLGLVKDYNLANKKLVDNPNVEFFDTKEEFDNYINQYYKIKYLVRNESLMNANLNQKIQEGVINLDEIKVDWTDQEELKWLYEKGISGIQKKDNPPYIE